MPDFTHDFVTGFEGGFPIGVDIYNKTRNFRLMQAQFDHQKALDQQAAEIAKQQHDLEMAKETERQNRLKAQEIAIGNVLKSMKPTGADATKAVKSGEKVGGKPMETMANKYQAQIAFAKAFPEEFLMRQLPRTEEEQMKLEGLRLYNLKTNAEIDSEKARAKQYEANAAKYQSQAATAGKELGLNASEYNSVLTNMKANPAYGYDSLLNEWTAEGFDFDAAFAETVKKLYNDKFTPSTEAGEITSINPATPRDMYNAGAKESASNRAYTVATSQVQQIYADLLSRYDATEAKKKLKFKIKNADKQFKAAGVDIQKLLDYANGL